MIWLERAAVLALLVVCALGAWFLTEAGSVEQFMLALSAFVLPPVWIVALLER